MKLVIKLFIGNSRVNFSRTPSFKPRPISQWKIESSTFELNMYGSLWGESLVLQLGNHLSVYRQKGSLWWALNQTISPINPSYEPQTGKTAGSSVTGNFGEVFTILALESLKPTSQFLGVCHITSTSGKRSPDLFVETSSIIDSYNDKFKLKKRSSPLRPDLPPLIPGECKNSDFLNALRQLAVYWYNSPGSRDYGYGLISTIDYKQPDEIFINLNLIIPKDDSLLRSMLVSEEVAKKIKQEDLEGIMYGFK
ncbi:hypothetical protein QNH36_22465 [Mesobacillus sp. AQ2]|uniref:hypothetical protein n=1 Tax=Mesobacillus sp. AQ2 TaxID=3043332 RepID=UPI0024C0F861|nr:hypothetical protein [Mesobacillus sp. AQ2]WHX40371.1 hypothetical protein QNH36_22465 [Mesobacillus sp. AQ2]